VGYHLAQLQVGGASALSNAMYILRYFGENINLLAETRRRKFKPKCVQTAGVGSDEVLDTVLKLAESYMICTISGLSLYTNSGV